MNNNEAQAERDRIEEQTKRLSESIKRFPNAQTPPTGSDVVLAAHGINLGRDLQLITLELRRIADALNK